MVANGEKLQGSDICNNVILSCQGCKMPVDLLILPLEGCQIVLGAQWMKKLGEITLNLDKLMVRFTYGNKTYTWQGIQQQDVKLVDQKILGKEHAHGQITIMVYSIDTKQKKETQNFLQKLPEEIQILLQQNPEVTSPIIPLPTQRQHDHKIP